MKHEHLPFIKQVDKGQNYHHERFGEQQALAQASEQIAELWVDVTFHEGMEELAIGGNNYGDVNLNKTISLCLLVQRSQDD